MKQRQALKVGIIGLGAVGQMVASCIENGDAGNATLVSLLCRDKQKNLARNGHQSDHFKSIITESREHFFAQQPDIVVEAAGQGTLNSDGIDVLQRGIDLVVSSIGLFTNDKLLRDFIDAADQSGSKILLSSGALPGVDWMSAASLAEVEQVSISQIKPTLSWQGTHAEELVDLKNITDTTCFFKGTAREAAHLFPKSSNITAMLALATAGLDSTNVELHADPVSSTMKTRVEFNSTVGNLNIDWQGVPSELNPSTSADVPLAIVKAIRNLTSPVIYGV
ncbi:aspartate dehydrogenase [Vibrio sp. WJH972]